LRAKVEEYLRMSHALEVFTGAPLMPEQLQAELDRMARQTRASAVLDELWAALDHDPLLLAECLARPVVAERELRKWYEKDEGGRMKDEARRSALHPSSLILHPFEAWWSGVREAMGVEVSAPEFAYRLPEIAAVAAPCGGDAWTATSTIGAPSARDGHSAVWTGSEMIVFGGGTGGFGTLNTGGRYNPATDSWTATTSSGAPSARDSHTAVWTGSEMIVWGGFGGSLLNTGGRYNPATNAWTAIGTTNAPNGRAGHTAVWTGSEMIVWGGDGGSTLINTGGRYNPITDSWTSTNITGAPSSRLVHTAVWTGSEMIVWGGFDFAANILFNTGGRYNPATNSWTITNTTGAPDSRFRHSAVWTGSEMIVWGGFTNRDRVNTGGRYNPATDSWMVTNVAIAPSERESHTAVWTGSEMIIWGGLGSSGGFNTGGRYNPTANSWIATIIISAPSARSNHTAVWTGSEMIIWGGSGDNAGGRYSLNLLTISPTTQSFTATGGPGSVAVTAQGGCTWTAMSNAGFITITSGSSGAGNGAVNFSVAANNSQNARTGTLTIGAQTFTVTQSGENPLPTLSGLNPVSASGGGSAFTLTITGAGFINGATVRWNGANRTTNFVSNTQLSAQIPASDLMTLGPATITIINPAPGGGASNALSFNVTASVSSISAASFSGAELAADSIVAAFGSELATQTLAAPVLPLPTTLAGTTVRVRDSAGMERLAPLFFVSPGQVNYLMPVGTAPGAATVTITSGSGKLSLGSVRIATVAPGLFAANANGQGVAAAVALRVRGDGTQSYEPVARFDAATGRFVPVPIDLGPATDQVFLILYGTGFRKPSALSAMTCRIGGTNAAVLFAGGVEGLVGLDQSNALIPRSLIGRGEVDVVLMVDGKAANTVRIGIL